jgi:AraC-like DNA-binding protein
MTDLEFLRQQIAGYADYANMDSRHQADKQIRAFLGEALSEARERLNPTGALVERIDGLILRCEFSDQRVIKAGDHARFDAALVDRVHELDREIVECAGRIRAVPTLDALAAELDLAARYLDERFGAIADAPSE